jgi:hypothetical protein
VVQALFLTLTVIVPASDIPALTASASVRPSPLGVMRCVVAGTDNGVRDGATVSTVTLPDLVAPALPQSSRVSRTH